MPRQTRGGRAPSKRRGGPRTGPDAPAAGPGRGPRAATPPEGRPGPGETRGRRRNGRPGAARWNAGDGPGPRAGRRRVASRPIRRREGDGARAGRGRRRNGRAGRRGRTREAGPDQGGPTPRGIEADPAEREPRNAGGPGPTPGTGGPAPSPKGGDPLSPFTPRRLISRGRRTPPTDSWGVRRPRGGQDARPIRPRMGPGANRPPAGRMTRAGRSGTSPAPGASPAGPWRAALARGRWPISGGGVGIPQAGARLAASVGPRQRSFRIPPASSSGPAPARRSARASPPRPSTRPRILDGLGHQLVMLGPDGQPAADLLEDLGGIPPAPGASCSRPARR